MSFILDALKKSETDRQRQSGPSLFEVKVAPPRRRLPVWAVTIAVLLGINLVVVSWMLLRHPSRGARAGALAASSRSAGASATAVPAPSTPTGARAPAPQPVASSGLPPATPTPAPAASARSAPAGAAAPAAPLPPAAAGGSPPAVAAAGGGKVWMAAEGSRPGSASDQTPAAAPPEALSAPAAEGNGPALPLYKQLASAPGATLPELHLDLHVYAPNPRKRYVMINMQKLQEGESLPDGVRVLTIRPDGVELSYQGTRFLLPRD
jgi:general secretion pathway protein B